jgi:hypothetical protein
VQIPRTHDDLPDVPSHLNGIFPYAQLVRVYTVAILSLLSK